LFETILLSSLLYSETVCRKVIPYLKAEYFEDAAQRWTFVVINDYVQEFNRCPTLKIVGINLSNRSDINENDFRATKEYIATQLINEPQDTDWLISESEKWVQDKALYHALTESIAIYNDKSGKKPRSSIPNILQQALAVAFDSHIGHDYFEDAELAYDLYHQKQKRISLGLKYLDKITNNGVPPKTLNVFAGGVGFGKTLILCHCAGSNLMDDKKVLYITLEMAETEIRRRIDVNLMNRTFKDLDTLSKDQFVDEIKELKEKTDGNLVIHEYPTGGAHVGNFRHLIHQLKIKKNFEPDIIYIDYLNICASSRMKRTSDLYSYVMTIAQEMRGLGVELNVPIISATQLNRKGYGSSDPEMSDVSESFGGPATFDLMLVIVPLKETMEMNEYVEEGQFQIKQLKNRYTNVHKDRTEIIAVNWTKMQLSDVEGPKRMPESESNKKIIPPEQVTKSYFEQKRRDYSGIT